MWLLENVKLHVWVTLFSIGQYCPRILWFIFILTQGINKHTQRRMPPLSLKIVKTFSDFITRMGGLRRVEML